VTRTIDKRYTDPADQVWLTCAERVGLRISRTRDAYAATDGRKELAIGEREVLDADDCLAQMIFHELCHSLIEGEESFGLPDWGLDNTTERDYVREHGCLRLQAHLAMAHGLREVLAPTTDFRAYYDGLGPDPLAERTLPATQLAITAARRSRTPPWAPHLDEALRATARIAEATSELAPRDSLWSLYQPTPPPHPTGLPGSNLDNHCGQCAWHYVGGRGRQVARCRQADDARIDPAWRGCARWEPPPDCQECGACCRAAYHSVTIPRRDPVRELHPELVVDRGQYVELKRSGDRCAALAGGRVEDRDERAFVPYRCLIYPDRPKPCRDFENSGEHCLTARRRVGLSL
jgi:hypothetical protein